MEVAGYFVTNIYEGMTIRDTLYKKRILYKTYEAALAAANKMMSDENARWKGELTILPFAEEGTEAKCAEMGEALLYRFLADGHYIGEIHLIAVFSA